MFFSPGATRTAATTSSWRPTTPLSCRRRNRGRWRRREGRRWQDDSRRDRGHRRQSSIGTSGPSTAGTICGSAPDSSECPRSRSGKDSGQERAAGGPCCPELRWRHQKQTLRAKNSSREPRRWGTDPSWPAWNVVQETSTGMSATLTSTLESVTTQRDASLCSAEYRSDLNSSSSTLSPSHCCCCCCCCWCTSILSFWHKSANSFRPDVGVGVREIFGRNFRSRSSGWPDEKPSLSTQQVFTFKATLFLYFQFGIVFFKSIGGCSSRKVEGCNLDTGRELNIIGGFPDDDDVDEASITRGWSPTCSRTWRFKTYWSQ